MNTDNRLVPQTEITQSNSIDMAKLVDRFVQFVEVSSSSVRTYSFGINRFMQFLGENSITQPTRESVLMYKNALIEKHCKPNTIALYLSSIRRFFTWLSAEGIYPNIAVNIKSPRIDTNHKKDCFSANQLKGIIQSMSQDTLEAKRNRAMFMLLTGCGLRTCEVVRTNVEDIREVMGVPVLYVQGKGKTSKGDFVKLAPQVLEAIREYLNARGPVEDSAPLFASCSRRNRGGRLTTRTVSGVCKTAMKAAGYDSHRLTAHSLRHTAVTLALLAGQSLEDVQHFARHSSITTTTIYSHVVNRLKSQCEEAIAGAIFAA